MFMRNHQCARRSARIKLHVAALAGALVLAALLPCSAMATRPAPPWSYALSSHYMTDLSISKMRGRACAVARSGVENAIVFFDFGAPWGTSATPKLKLFMSASGTRLVTFPEILSLLRVFSDRYHNCWQPVKRGSVKIVLGTNNVFPTRPGVPWGTNNQIAYDHGAALAQAVRSYQQWIRASHGVVSGQNVIYNRQAALAGSDIELTTIKGWNGPVETKRFVDGYNSVTNRMNFINYGSNEVGTCTNASACADPMKYGGWDAQSVYYVSRGAVNPSFPTSHKVFACPQIYSDYFRDSWRDLQLLAANRLAGATRPASMNQGLMQFYCTVSTGSEIQVLYRDPQTAWSQFDTALGPARPPDAEGINTLFKQLTYFKPLRSE